MHVSTSRVLSARTNIGVVASYILGAEMPEFSHIATDGNYYFVRVAQGFFKLGTGEGGTHRNFVYHSNMHAGIKLDDGTTHAPLFYLKNKLVCLACQRGRSSFIIINSDTLKEEKTIEVKEEYTSNNVRVITDYEKFYVITTQGVQTSAESSIWLLIDEYVPNADWSAVKFVTRVKLNITSGIEDLIAASFGANNEPYSPSMKACICTSITNVINAYFLDGLPRDDTGQVHVNNCYVFIQQRLI